MGLVFAGMILACQLHAAGEPTVTADGSLEVQSTGIPITLTPEIRHQEMVGFGAALSWNTGSIYSGTAQKAAALEAAMFEDLGLDILRLKNWYYPDDEDSVNAMRSHDNNHRLFHAAKAANPDVQVLYSSWSPPASLKSNGQRRNGGTLKKDANGNYMYQEFADYWVDVLDNLGWTPDYLSFQNEPGWVATWETCVFAPNQTTSSAGYAQAADAIWDAIKDRPDVPKMVGSEAENMPAFFNLNQPLLSRPYFAVHGYHVYDIANSSQIDSSTTINRLRRIRDDFGDRPNWQTEFSREFNWIDAARVIHNTLVEANASAYVYWMLYWGRDRPEAMIEHVDNNSFQINPPYYTIKHYAKHVHQGYQRIEVGGSNSNVRVSGYLSPQGNRITLVAINRATTSQAISLVHDNLPVQGIEGYQSVDGNFYQPMAGMNPANPVTLPASSLTTLVLTLEDHPAIAVYDGETLVPLDDTRVFAVTPGTPVSHTYAVKNLGTADLLLTGTPDTVVFAESDTTSHNGFTISPIIPGGSTTLAPGTSTNFTVTFQTATSGTFSGTIHIANNDADKDPYTFTVTASTESYTITYDGNGNTGGSAPPPQTKPHGVPLALAGNTGNLQKTGFIFAGWNTAANGSGVDYPEEAMFSIDADTTLHAKWRDPEIFLTQNQPFNHPAGWTDGAYWSDGAPAGAGREYAVFSGRAVHTPDASGTQTFPGDRLTLGNASSLGTLRLNRSGTGARTTVVNDLQVIQGRLETTNWNTLHTVRTASGSIPVGQSISIRARSSDTGVAGFIIDASLTGTNADVQVEGRDAFMENNQIRFQRANSISGSIRSNSFADLVINHANALQNLTLNRQAGDTGVVTFNQNSLLGGLSGSENINFGGRVISVGNNHTSTTYSGEISNGSLTKVGEGTLTLPGANAYAGATTVNGGTLRVDGSLAAGSAVTVNDGGTLAGEGTIGGGLTIADGGIFLADGAALTVGGAVTLSPGCFLDAGDITPVGDDPIILMTCGSLTGTFGSVNAPVGWSVDYEFGGNSIALVSTSPGSLTITFDANNGTTPVPQTKQVTYDSPYGALATTERSGYTFVGWFTEASGGSEVTAATVVATEGDHTLHARWNALPLVSAGPDQTVALVNYTLWTPAQISTAAWFDAADADTLIISGGAVSQWNDKSGNGNHAMQASAPNRPTVGTVFIGGKSTVSFRTLHQQALTAPNDASLRLDDTGGANVFTVMKFGNYVDQGSGLNVALSKGQLLSASTSYGIRVGSNSLGYQAGSPNGQINSAMTDGRVLLLSGVRRDSEKAAALYFDGVPAGSRTNIDAIVSNNDEPLHIGRDPSSSRYANVDFGEILILGGELSTADRQRIEGYLAHKWGFAGDLPAGHPHQATAPGSNTAMAILNGIATDPEDDSLTVLWTLTQGPAAVSFGDPSSPQTTATFTMPGTYILRLTASDGFASAHDECVVTVGSLFESWAAENGLTGGDAGPNADPDGDGLTNLQEFAFGMDPGSPFSGWIVFDAGDGVVTPGLPVPVLVGLGDASAVFARRKNHAAAGLSYVVEFTADLQSWYRSTAVPAVVASDPDRDVEAVGVHFPAEVPAGQGMERPRFFRVGVSLVP